MRSGGERTDPLRYTAAATSAAGAGEFAFVKLRYKTAQGADSQLLSIPVTRAQIAERAGARLQQAAAVAAFAQRL